MPANTPQEDLVLHRTIPTRRLLLLAVLTAFLAACGASGASPAATQSAPAPANAASPSNSAGQMFSLPEKGFGLTLADGWQRLPLDQAGVTTAIGALPADSYLRGFLQGESESQAAFDFWAYIAAGPDGDPAGFRTVNIATAPAAGVDLIAVEPSLTAKLTATQGVADLESGMVTLPAGQALRITFTVSDPAAPGGKLFTTQYYVPLGDTIAAVTFVSDAETEEVNAIINSLEAAS